jgi:hypothetical protein
MAMRRVIVRLYNEEAINFVDRAAAKIKSNVIETALLFYLRSEAGKAHIDSLTAQAISMKNNRHKNKGGNDND